MRKKLYSKIFLCYILFQILLTIINYFMKQIQTLLGCSDFVAMALMTFVCLMGCLFVVAVIWELVVERTNNNVSNKRLESIAFWLFYMWLVYFSVCSVLFGYLPCREDDNMMVIMVALLFSSIMIARSFALFVTALAKDTLKFFHRLGEFFSKNKSGQD